MKLKIQSLFHLFIVVLLINCKSKPEVKSNQDFADNHLYKSIIEKFSPLYNETLDCDSNSFIFIRNSSLDTSYLLQLKKLDSSIQGVCYMLLPSLHRGFKDFRDQKSELILFIGLSFVMEKNDWEVLKKNAKTLQPHAKTLNSGAICFDCNSFALFHNNMKRFSDNPGSRQAFNALDSFIRTDIINFHLQKIDK